jgi:hypothetical protein
VRKPHVPFNGFRRESAVRLDPSFPVTRRYAIPRFEEEFARADRPLYRGARIALMIFWYSARIRLADSSSVRPTNN